MTTADIIALINLGMFLTCVLTFFWLIDNDDKRK